MAKSDTKLRRSGADRLLMAFIAIPAVITATLIIVPLLSGISLSFFKISSFNPAATPQFVGLKNIIKVGSSDAFSNAFRNGVVFTATSVLIQVIAAVCIALALNRRFPLRSVVRTAIIIPMLVPTVVVSTIDRYIMNESFGVVSKVTTTLGFEPIAWGTPGMVMWHVIGLGVWLWLPFMVLSILAELQSIPRTLYEAARVDGANAVQQFWHVTLPHLASVLGIVILLRSIWTFNNFELIYLTTGGGPLGLTETLPILAYRQSFTAFDIGAGASTSTLSFLFLLTLVLVSYRFLRLNKS